VSDLWKLEPDLFCMNASQGDTKLQTRKHLNCK